MAYNFLDLTNEVNRSFNEVELTSSNFSTATGFYAKVKDSINTAIRDINHTHYEWPFNHVLAEETLSAGTIRYAYPTDANTLDYDTFRIKEDATLGNRTIKLSSISYEDYLDRYIDHEYTTDTNKRTVPTFVFQTPSLEYGVVPAPDQAYELLYEYYRVPVDLESYDDVPDIPERFRHVIVDGAMFYAYMFRGNEQSANIAKQKYEEGIKRMRSMLVNRYSYVRSGMIIPASGSIRSFGDRVK
jgi:hypothetical protein